VQTTILANYNSVQKLFNQQVQVSQSSQETSATQSNHKVQVLTSLAMNKAITAATFNINLETVSINKATNVPQDEQD
jgi:hypothetical protein